MNSLTEPITPPAAARVGRVRAFTRFYTNALGVLKEGLLDTPHSLTEARLIFELAQREATPAAQLRRVLNIDAGYLSRILTRLEAEGLIDKERLASDQRRQVITLTRRGRAAFELLDRRSAEQIQGLLSGLSETDQRRLVAAMAEIERLLGSDSSRGPVVMRPPVSGDFGWVVERHGALYRDEYGWDESFEALVGRLVADYIERADRRREAAWIAELDGERVGCVFCTKKDGEVAKLRLLLVEPTARGLGIGSRLVDECIRFARRAGYKHMTLWTNDVLVDARRIYERAGFRLVKQEKHRSFGHDLVGQDWWLTL
jgi:DNA-binding MarR family transcriptional regulator/GNAT superfamily N-acetyltransferase